MFAYCSNNPVMFVDNSGFIFMRIAFDGGSGTPPESSAVGEVSKRTRKTLFGFGQSTFSTSYDIKNQTNMRIGIVRYSYGDYINSYVVQDESNATISAFFNQNVEDVLNGSTAGVKISDGKVGFLQNVGASDFGPEIQFVNGNKTNGYKYRLNMAEHSIGIEWYTCTSIGNVDLVHYQSVNLDVFYFIAPFAWDGSGLFELLQNTNPGFQLVPAY